MEFCAYRITTAGDAGAASPEGRRLIRIIVPARVDHNRMAAYVLDGESRRKDRQRRLAVSVHHQRREIALMATGVVGTEVLAGMVRDVMAARGEARCHLALIFCGPARSFLMNVETVNARR